MFFGSDSGNLEISKIKPQVYLMTYHSAKGLDFPHVFLPSLNDDFVFWRDNERISKTLFFVGLTRTSKNLYLSYNSDQPHPYLAKIMPEEGPIPIDDVSSPGTDSEEDPF